MQRQLQLLTHETREQIKLCQKKQVDISDLIRDKDISNENLSNCFISDLNLSEQSISNVNFNGAKMQFIFVKGTARNCTFLCSHLLPGSSIRAADMRTCNMNGMYSPQLDFSYADLRDVDVCSTTFTFFSKLSYKAKFSKKFLDIIARFSDVEGLNT